MSKINHELRNLLTTAQLLSDRLDGVADPIVQRVAPRLVATLDRAIRFCEETLAYGRANERNPHRRLVPLAPIIAEQADLSGRERGSNIVIREICPASLKICVDPEQLSRALANIVRNAVEALAPPGIGQEPQKRADSIITIEARRVDTGGSGGTMIRVADNGPGLPARAREHLFSPFRGSSRSGGTGLGLAIASELIQLNGGTLSLEGRRRGHLLPYHHPGPGGSLIREVSAGLRPLSWPPRPRRRCRCGRPCRGGSGARRSGGRAWPPATAPAPRRRLPP